MELHEFHNHEGAADKARLNRYRDWDMPPIIIEDDDSGDFRQVYRFNRVKGDFFK